MSTDSPRDSRAVLVLNQYALPRSQPGGTRHAEIFARTTGWNSCIVAGDRNHYTQQRMSAAGDPRFALLPVPRSDGTAVARLRGWCVYCVGAIRLGQRVRRPDVVLASSPHLLTPLAGLVVARTRRVPFVLEVRDLWPKSVVDAGVIREGGASHRLLRVLEAFLYRSATQIIAVTGGWEAHFAEAGVDLAKVHVVPNGASVEDFVVHENRDDLRHEYGLRRFTAVFAGAHGTKDGLEKIREAARDVPDIDILFVGSGTEKARLVKEVQDEGPPNVRFLDPLPKSDLPRLLAACDVGIHAVSELPVFEQGMSPNKLFDYLAAGLPVVSNAEAALAGVVGQDECGRLGGADDLARLFREVRDAPSHVRERWALNGRRCVVERFSRERSAAILANALDQALT